MFLKISQISQEIPVLESLFNKVFLIKFLKTPFFLQKTSDGCLCAYLGRISSEATVQKCSIKIAVPKISKIFSKAPAVRSYFLEIPE